MSRFDEEPDDDIHGRCAHEIRELEAEVRKLQDFLDSKDMVPRSRLNAVEAELKQAEDVLKTVQRVAFEKITELETQQKNHLKAIREKTTELDRLKDNPYGDALPRIARLLDALDDLTNDVRSEIKESAPKLMTAIQEIAKPFDDRY